MISGYLIFNRGGAYQGDVTILIEKLIALHTHTHTLVADALVLILENFT